MIVDLTKKSLDVINNKPKLKKYLSVVPFDENHLVLSIWFKESDGSTILYPDLSHVFLCRGVISYSRMLNQNYEEAGKDDSEEYEHAVLLLDREPS